MSRSEVATLLPAPEPKAYFPQVAVPDWQSEWAVKKAGEENLVYAIGYGSQVAGGASPTSIHDFFLVVDNLEDYHQRALADRPKDYGHPRNSRWHTALNWGPSYYITEIPTDAESLRAKCVVIGKDNFVRGSRGSLARRDRVEPGSSGIYVAGRMQKVALSPIFVTENKEDRIAVESSINKARIDGIWLAFGLLRKKLGKDAIFGTGAVINEYVPLSYLGDVRIENPRKVQTIIGRSRKDYVKMMEPLLVSFSEAGIIDFKGKNQDGEMQWRAFQAPSRGEIFSRIVALKASSARQNYFNNVLTVGPLKGAVYAGQKVMRAIRH